MFRLLDDSVINAYGSLLQNHYMNMLWLHTFVYGRITQNAAKNSDSYTAARQLIPNVYIFQRDLVIVPIHLQQATHWAMVAVNHRRRVVQYYDSLGSNGRGVAVTVRDFFAFVSQQENAGVDIDGYRLQSRVPGIPLQTNAVDCGVFMLVYADCLARDVRMSFTQRSMPSYRKHILVELLTGNNIDRN